MKKLILKCGFALLIVLFAYFLQRSQPTVINNIEAHWQYLSNQKGEVFLALEVSAPSGVRLDQILTQGRDCTGSWVLANPPDWHHPLKFRQFDSSFHQYIQPFIYAPKNNETLYANHFFTYLYRWSPLDKTQKLPDEDSLKIVLKNAVLGNRIQVTKRVAPSLIVSDLKDVDGQISMRIEMYKPKGMPDTLLKGYGLFLNNLKSASKTVFLIKDPARLSFAVSLKKDEVLVDAVSGFVKSHGEIPDFVYYKSHDNEQGVKIDFAMLFRHALVFCCVCWFALCALLLGKKIERKFKWEIDGALESAVFSFFIGVVALTYAFFLLGLFKGLYLSVIVLCLMLLSFWVIDESAFLWTAVKKSWCVFCEGRWGHILVRGVSLLVLMIVFIMHLFYVFMPAVYFDASGDITTCYMPNLNHYLVTHSFSVPIENPITGIFAQTFDVLRSVLYMLAGEQGVYGWTLIFIVALFTVIYVLMKRVLRVRYPLVYLSLLAFMTSDLFFEYLHFGRSHILALTFLFAFLLSLRHINHKTGFIFAPIFLGFLISQYIPFIFLALTYVLLVFIDVFCAKGQERKERFNRALKAYGILFIVSSIFHAKLLIEIGVFLPPAMVPESLSNLFAKLNADNSWYRFINNNYVRNFCMHNGLMAESHKFTLALLWKNLKPIIAQIDFKSVLLFLPFFLFKKDRFLFFLATSSVFLIYVIFFPVNSRFGVYALYPILVMQLFCVDHIVEKIVSFIKNEDVKRRVLRIILIVLICFMVLFRIDKGALAMRRASFLNLITDPLHMNGRAAWAQKIACGLEPPYGYLKRIYTDPEMFPNTQTWAHENFDYSMLARSLTQGDDMVLIVPTRFHHRMQRLASPRHGLGSVLYQQDISQVMKDLQELKIGYLSYMPMNYRDYNPFYAPIFNDDVFYKYFKPLVVYHGRILYKIIYDGSQQRQHKSPINYNGREFVPMSKFLSP